MVYNNLQYNQYHQFLNYQHNFTHTTVIFYDTEPHEISTKKRNALTSPHAQED